mgnify:CR=1 FL=1
MGSELGVGIHTIYMRFQDAAGAWSISEDQEVIVFMDEKVKQLEKTVGEMKSKTAGTKQESIDIVKKNEKKSRVLSDM